MTNLATTTPSFPAEIKTIGKKVEYLSKVVMPERRFDEYITLYRTFMAEDIHYVDPVHEMHGRENVLGMLNKYVERVYNGGFKFDLLVDGENEAIWRWTIELKVKKFPMIINGLVHAKAENGKIVYQREYYDPMESIEVIPVVGKLYKKMLRNA